VDGTLGVSFWKSDRHESMTVADTVKTYLALRGSNLGQDGHERPDQVQEADYQREEKKRRQGQASVRYQVVQMNANVGRQMRTTLERFSSSVRGCGPVRVFLSPARVLFLLPVRDVARGSLSCSVRALHTFFCF